MLPKIFSVPRGPIALMALLLFGTIPANAQTIFVPGYAPPYYGGYYALYQPVYHPPMIESPVILTSFTSSVTDQPDNSYGAAPRSGTEQPSYYNEDYSGATRTTPIHEEIAQIRVRLPAGAELWIDGDKTSQTGTVRHFVTPKLNPERVYTYPVRARWLEDGITVEKSLNVKAFAGNRVTVNFVRPQVLEPRRQPTVQALTATPAPATLPIEQASPRWTAPRSFIPIQ